jgi:ribosomal subunit interface protein
MIKLEIGTEDYDLDSDLKKRIEDRIGGLDEYMDALDEGHVTVSWEGGPNEQTRVRAQVWGPGHKFEGSDTDWTPVTAIDKTRQKLETQIRRARGKRIDERDRGR